MEIFWKVDADVGVGVKVVLAVLAGPTQLSNINSINRRLTNTCIFFRYPVIEPPGIAGKDILLPLAYYSSHCYFSSSVTVNKHDATLAQVFWTCYCLIYANARLSCTVGFGY
jgi:hypothetical protein